MFKLDLERQKLARSFKRANSWISIFSWLILFGYSGLWIFFRVAGDKNNEFIKFLAIYDNFLLALFTFHFSYAIFQFPVFFAANIWLPKRYGASTGYLSNWVGKYIVFSIFRFGPQLLIAGFLYLGVHNYLIGKSWFFLVIGVGFLGKFFYTIC